MHHLSLFAAVLVSLLGASPAAAYEPPPANAKFDYQIGDPYQPPKGTRVVSRDWFEGDPLAGERSYSTCYVNAFQTQDDSRSIDRPDERSNWPADLVLDELGDDPNWRGEYLIDISTAEKRERAAEWIEQMIDTCAAKGFDAVEYDNLDSWTRFRRTEVADQVSIGRAEAIAFAELITDRAHALDLAVAQKNTVQLSREQARKQVGFDFAVAEECGRYNECNRYRKLFGKRVVVVEYNRKGFRRACRQQGRKLSIVLRDLNVVAPGTKGYRHRVC